MCTVVGCIPESSCWCLFIPLFFHFSFSPILSQNFWPLFSQGLYGVQTWNLVHMVTMGWCIMFTGIRLLLLIHPFISSFFFFSMMYRVYWNQAAVAYFSLFFFLSNFQAFFLGIVRPRRLKLHVNVNSGWCIVYTEILLLLLILHFISLFFFLSNFQNFKNYDTHFSGSVRPRKLKLGTHVDNGWMYCVYWKQAAAYLSLYFFLSHSQFSIKKIVAHFSGTVRPRKLKYGQWVDI